MLIVDTLASFGVRVARALEIPFVLNAVSPIVSVHAAGLFPRQFTLLPAVTNTAASSFDIISYIRKLMLHTYAASEVPIVTAGTLLNMVRVSSCMIWLDATVYVLMRMSLQSQLSTATMPLILLNSGFGLEMAQPLPPHIIMVRLSCVHWVSCVLYVVIVMA